MRSFALPMSLLGLALAPCAAYAATDTDQFQVTATVIAACDVVAQDLPFLNYDPVSSSPLDASATVAVTCTNGTTYNVGLDAGAGSGATVSSRRMTSGANTLSYSIYTNAARSTVWGATLGVDTVAGTGTGAQQTLTMYGRAPAHQTAPTGSYTDTVTVTVTY